MAGLDPAIQRISNVLAFFGWMAGSEPGHDDGIGGDIRLIKFRDDGCGDPLANPAKSYERLMGRSGKASWSLSRQVSLT